MSTNPFEKSQNKQYVGSYCSFVKNQILSMNVDESKKVDTGGLQAWRFQAAMSREATKLGCKFKSMQDCDNNLWVKRIS